MRFGQRLCKLTILSILSSLGGYHTYRHRHFERDNASSRDSICLVLSHCLWNQSRSKRSNASDAGCGCSEKERQRYFVRPKSTVGSSRALGADKTCAKHNRTLSNPAARVHLPSRLIKYPWTQWRRRTLVTARQATVPVLVPT
jgi:hypothetical protein